MSGISLELRARMHVHVCVNVGGDHCADFWELDPD